MSVAQLVNQWDTTNQWVAPDGLAAFASAYPGKPVGVQHLLHGHPLFALDALADLAARLPASHVEHSRGDLAIDQDPDGVTREALPVDEIVRTIADNGCWMVLKKVDEDPDYAELIDACLAEIDPVVRPRTGANMRREAFIFLSSPNSVTPYHMDPEHNILFQVAGFKTMRVFSADRFTLVTQEHQEAFHRAGGHRNMRFDPAFDAYGIDFVLAPGDAVYVPVKAPHWVRNGPMPSISFSVTWRSRSSDNDARLHRVNHRLRKLGINPGCPGDAPRLDAAKVAAHHVVKGVTRTLRTLMGKKTARAAY
jgi:mannose-6-phosphate isomerase-like protein (cupin superfamily)